MALKGRVRVPLGCQVPPAMPERIVHQTALPPGRAHLGEAAQVGPQTAELPPDLPRWGLLLQECRVHRGRGVLGLDRSILRLRGPEVNDPIPKPTDAYGDPHSPGSPPIAPSPVSLRPLSRGAERRKDPAQGTPGQRLLTAVVLRPSCVLPSASGAAGLPGSRRTPPG